MNMVGGMHLTGMSVSIELSEVMGSLISFRIRHADR
jgi:hypothetical protein